MSSKKVVGNAKSTVPELRQNIRAQVFAIERRIAQGDRGVEIHKLLLSAASRVGRLNSYHPSEGGRLELRLKELRKKIELESLASPVLTAASVCGCMLDAASPWD